MKRPPLGPGRQDITWPNQVAPLSRKASSTRNLKPQTSNRISLHLGKRVLGVFWGTHGCGKPNSK